LRNNAILPEEFDPEKRKRRSDASSVEGGEKKSTPSNPERASGEREKSQSGHYRGPANTMRTGEKEKKVGAANKWPTRNCRKERL